MPFALTHKASKGRLESRRPAPTPLELRQDQIHSNSLPTPPSTGDAMAPNAGFKMFRKKRATSTDGGPRPVFPSEPPRPILKTRQNNGGGPSIRFEGKTPQVVVSQYDPQPVFEMQASVTRAPSPVRRSSRPTSPAASSFGTRVRAETAPAASSFGSRVRQDTALSTPPMPSHVTTPPTAYVSSMQTRAPPPPSPYRPTHERSRSIIRTSIFPESLPMTTDFVPRPPRHSSLFPSSESTSTLPGSCVPMLNIIPATPQDSYEEFSGASVAPRQKRSSAGLEEAVRIDEMEDIPLDPPGVLPSIDVNLDFSPFDTHVSLPLEPLDDAPCDPLPPSPPSPPFQSFPSLPSLESHNSMPSSGSEDSMPSSASNSSLISFPDVEEALGSMLASLSDTNMAGHNVNHGLGLGLEKNPGLGLGLGLDLPETATITAPLSPRRRPPPLDLRASAQLEQTAPPCVNHRVAFYGTARAHPNSPTSGISTPTHSPTNSFELPSHRDSISLASEASDDDLHTASIISLTPVVGDRAVMMEVMLSAEMEIEIDSQMGVEVGLAF